MSAKAAAERHLEAGDFPQAVELFRKALADSPDDPDLRGSLGRAYQGAGDDDRAFHHFDQAARAFAAMGEDARAASLFAAADRVVPNLPEVLFRLGGCLERLKREDGMLEVAERLLEAAPAAGDRRRGWAVRVLAEAQPDNVHARAREAAFFAEVGDVERAAQASIATVDLAAEDESVFEALSETSRRLPALAPRIAEALLKKGAPSRGIHVLAPSLESGEEQPGTLDLAARCYEAMDEAATARPLRIQLIDRALRAGDLTEAETHARQLEPLAGEDAEALGAVARVYEAQASPRAARFWLKAALAHHRADEAAHRDRAILCLLRSGTKEPAILQSAAELLEHGGRAKEAAALRERLRALETEEQTPYTGLAYGRGLAFGPARSRSPRREPPPLPGDKTDDILRDTFDES